MDRAYRWFLGILGATLVVLLAVFELVRLGVIGFTLQLCSKGGSCTAYGPTGYVEQLAVGLAFAAAVALVAGVVSVIYGRRRRSRPRAPTAVLPARTDTRLPEGRSPGA